MTYPEWWPEWRKREAEECGHPEGDSIPDDTYEGPFKDSGGYDIIPPATCGRCGAYLEAEKT